MAVPAVTGNFLDDGDLLEAIGRDIRDYLDERFAALPEPPAPTDVEALVAEMRSYVDQRLAALPEPETPVINVPVTVAPAHAAVEVNIPEQLAPIVNVETVAPVINVEPTPITVTSPNVEMMCDMTPVERGMTAQTLATQGHAEAIERKLDLLITATNALAKAMADQAKALSAPKTLIMQDGKPIGVKLS